MRGGLSQVSLLLAASALHERTRVEWVRGGGGMRFAA